MAGVGNMESKYDKFPGATNVKTAMIIDASGLHLAYAPEWTINAAVEHRLGIAGGTLTSRLDVQYIDDRYGRGTVANNPEELIPSQSLVNARFSWRTRGGNWGVAAWVKNAADDDTQVHATFAAGGLGGRGALGQFQQPRTYGATLDYRF